MKVDPSRILGSRSGLEPRVLGHSAELYENDRLPSYAFGRVLKKVSPFSVVFSLLNHHLTSLTWASASEGRQFRRDAPKF